MISNKNIVSYKNLYFFEIYNFNFDSFFSEVVYKI